MALSPLQPDNRGNIIETDKPISPSKTLSSILRTGKLGGFIDEELAMRQFIEKAVRTARFRHLIYDDEYGCELDDLIGSDVTQELISSEIPRVVKEALIYDDRIESVGWI